MDFLFFFIAPAQHTFKANAASLFHELKATGSNILHNLCVFDAFVMSNSVGYGPFPLLLINLLSPTGLI